VDTNDAIRRGANAYRDAAIDRHRQNEAVVVVGVLADQVDAAWGHGHAVRVAAELTAENFPRPRGQCRHERVETSPFIVIQRVLNSRTRRFQHAAGRESPETCGDVDGPCHNPAGA
jgi:hypothetical protein